MRFASAILLASCVLAIGCGPSPGYYDLTKCDPPRPPPEVEEHDVTTAVPRPTPFAPGQTWVGTYMCPQGETNLALRIVTARRGGVVAIFDFEHVPTGAKGSYLMRGRFDYDSGDLALRPTRWIEQPDDYEMVGMEGHVTGATLSGNITDDRCGSFSVKLAR